MSPVPSIEMRWPSMFLPPGERSGRARRGGCERERARRIGHEPAAAYRLVHSAVRQDPGEAVEQPHEPGSTTVDAVVATPGGIHPEHDPLAMSVLDHPADELDGPVRLVILPAERAVVLAVRPGRQQLPVIAAIDDLVDVAQHDVSRRDAVIAQDPDLLERARAVLAVGEDRDARSAMGLGCGLEHASVTG